jgi:signal transduction histidine kinase
MKNKLIELSRLYHASLQNYLQQGSSASMEPAREMGRQAISLGLETLDLARIHEIALVSLVLPTHSVSINTDLMGRAGLFFAEALTPIEETHRGAREANTHLNEIVKALSQRTLELAEAVEGLKVEIDQRKSVEESLRASELTSSKLLLKSRQMQEELRTLSRKLITLQEEERKKISRELHDVIAQTLTGINVRLATLKADTTVSTTVLHKKIASTQRLVEKSVDIVHRFARELRPSVLDDLGLIPALEAFMKGFTKDTGIRASLKAFAGIELSDSNRRTVLYRIAQEALTNVARHAKASRAEVNITNSNGVISMEIKDNGQGFEVDGTSCANKNSRLGLLGMRERIEMIGGTFCVESAPGKPTTVRVEIPVMNSSTRKSPTKKSVINPTLECP